MGYILVYWLNTGLVHSPGLRKVVMEITHNPCRAWASPLFIGGGIAKFIECPPKEPKVGGSKQRMDRHLLGYEKR